MSSHRHFPTWLVLLTLLAVPGLARAQYADQVLWYNTSNLAFNVSELINTMNAVGASHVDNTDTWPADLSAYRIVFMVIPRYDLTQDQVDDVVDFVAAGGLLVSVADNDNYDDEYGRLNSLIGVLGLDSEHYEGNYDPTCPKYATITTGNPLVEGVGTLAYASSSDIVVAGDGEVLATGESGQTLLVYEDHVLLAADSGIFHDWCGPDPGNYTLYENLFTAWCDMDLDGVDKPICGGDDCDDDNDSVHPGVPEVLDGLDNDCNGLADDGMVAEGAVIVSEFMKDPSAVADAFGEWFELYNTTVDTVNLLGMQVTDLGSNSFEVTTNLWIGPGETIVLGREGDTGLNGGVPLDYVYADFTLGNTGDDEVILTLGAVELDRIVYDDVDWPDTSGASAALDPTAYDAALNDDPVNWCDGAAAYGDGDLGTPGAPNPPCCADADADGFLDAACGGDDCDDTDSAVFPGAAEVLCDAVDNDCDPVTEDDPDADGDAFGVCTDCDDADTAVHPNAGETHCDGLDNDCDPATEDEPDEDADGHTVCTDCDDADPAVHPGATEVECDGLDNDCDVATEDAPDLDGDGYSMCDDCNDADATIHEGAAELHDGLDNDCDGLFDEGVLPTDALFVTEIMRDPDAVSDSDGEWLELYNNTAVDMNLVGLVVYDLGSDSFTVESDLFVPAGEHVVLGENADTATNGEVDLDYECSGLTLGNSEDELYLEHGGIVLDTVLYGAGWPDLAGHAMSLGPDFYDPILNDDPANWCDAPWQWASGDSGSPGDMNPVCCSDEDGDGYDDAACGGDDCDDTDADVSPDATEVECDGVDNDCDEDTEDEPDADGDGVTACDDCDDEDADTYPDAAEQCDGIDNDCDGEIDEDVDEDVDGDGYNACQGDCDNENPDTYPDAEEICDDEDNDCDGDIDEDLECDPADDDDDDDDDDDVSDDDDSGDDLGDCNCRLAGTRPTAGPVLAGLLILAVTLRRRR